MKEGNDCFLGPHLLANRWNRVCKRSEFKSGGGSVTQAAKSCMRRQEDGYVALDCRRVLMLTYCSTDRYPVPQIS